MWQPKPFAYLALTLVPSLTFVYGLPKEGQYCADAHQVLSPSGRVEVTGSLCFGVNHSPFADLYLNVSSASWLDGTSWVPADAMYPLSAEIGTSVDGEDEFEIDIKDVKAGGFSARIGQIKDLQAGAHAIDIHYTQHGPKFLDTDDTVSFSGEVQIDVPPFSL